MKVSREYKDMFNSINQSLDSFDKSGIHSNASELMKNEISNFYASIGKDVKNDERINLNVKLTDEQQEQFNSMILNMAQDEQQLDFDKIIEGFKNQNPDNQFYFDNIQDYVNFIDNMNKYKSSSSLSSIFSSDQWQALNSYGQSKGFLEDDIENIIWTTYSETGLTYDSLYNEIMNTMLDIEKTSWRAWENKS